MYKPQGFTSFDVIAKMRGILNMKRLGHAGTLDPMAEGVLPVFAGRATMALDSLPSHDKNYRAYFRLGILTDTEDITGKILDEKNFEGITGEMISGTLKAFTGEILQTPPMYSAVKQDGKKLYELARKNIEVERKPRKITVYEASLESFDEITGEGTLSFFVSGGTYIRTLISDIGKALGTYAVMTKLVRTKACGFEAENAVTFEALEKIKNNGGDFSSVVFPTEEIFRSLPKAYLTPEEERLYRNGIPLTAKRICLDETEGEVCVSGKNGFFALACIAESKEGKIIRAKKTFVLDESPQYKGEYAAALGLFDGVHAGHRAVLSETLKTAGKINLKSAVFTFCTEDFSAEEKNLCGKNLMTEKEKERNIHSLGIDAVFSPEFKTLCDMNAEDFVKIILRDRMRAGFVVCGEDFRCGKGASCNADELRLLCEKYGIGFKSVKLITNEENGDKISSRYIRELIENGKLQQANALMNSPYSFVSPVLRGKQLGRTLGFPTINQKIPRSLVSPRFGVYRARITLMGKTYDGLANVGVKPTVSESGDVLCETHIFDFSEEVYGFRAKTVLCGFIREERKFSSVDELKLQVLSDIENIKGMIQT